MIREDSRKKNPKTIEKKGLKSKGYSSIDMEVLLKTLETSIKMDAKVEEKTSLPRYD